MQILNYLYVCLFWLGVKARLPTNITNGNRRLALSAEWRPQYPSTTEHWSYILDHGSLSSMPSYEEADSLMQSFMQTHPRWLLKFQAGESVEGRPMWAYRLGQNGEDSNQTVAEIFDPMTRKCLAAPPPTFDLNTYSFTSVGSRYPQTLLTAVHHAREPAALTSLLFFVGQLLELGAETFNSTSSSLPMEEVATRYVAQYILRHHEIIILPFVNPDGYVAMKRTGNHNIRKNQRVTCPLRINNTEVQGVDLNRNYDFAFTNTHPPCDEQEYEGTFPFSEPETQAVKCLVESFQFKTALNFHTFGGVWTRPFNCCTDKQLPVPVKEVYDELKQSIAVTNFDSAPNVPILGYTTTGEADDWMLGRHGIISMSPEVGDEEYGFFPPQTAIRGINENSFWHIVDVVMKAGPEIHIGTETVTEDNSLSWKFQLFNSGLSPSPTNATLVVFKSAEAPKSPASLVQWKEFKESESQPDSRTSLFVPFPWSPYGSSSRRSLQSSPATTSSLLGTSPVASLPPRSSSQPVRVRSSVAGTGTDCYICFLESSSQSCRCAHSLCFPSTRMSAPLMVTSEDDPICQTARYLASNQVSPTPAKQSTNNVLASPATKSNPDFLMAQSNDQNVESHVLGSNKASVGGSPAATSIIPKSSSSVWVGVVIAGEFFVSCSVLFVLCWIISEDGVESKTSWGRFASSVVLRVSGLLCCLPCCLRVHRKARAKLEYGRPLDQWDLPDGTRHSSYDRTSKSGLDGNPANNPFATPPNERVVVQGWDADDWETPSATNMRKSVFNPFGADGAEDDLVAVEMATKGARNFVVAAPYEPSKSSTRKQGTDDNSTMSGTPSSPQS